MLRDGSPTSGPTGPVTTSSNSRDCPARPDRLSMSCPIIASGSSCPVLAEAVSWAWALWTPAAASDTAAFCLPASSPLATWRCRIQPTNATTIADRTRVEITTRAWIERRHSEVTDPNGSATRASRPRWDEVWL